MKKNKLLSCLFCVVAAVAFVIVGWLLGLGYYLLFPRGSGSYWASGTLNMLLAGLTILALWGLKKAHILKDGGEGFWSGIKIGGFLAFMILYLLIAGVAEGAASGTLQPIETILGFAFSMFAVGFSEELLFRGLIQNVLADCFGRDSARGVWLTVIASGVVFGLTHLFNILTAGITPLAGAMQAVAAVGVGVYFGAIYARCGNLWVLICLHSLNDFAALVTSGLWETTSVIETIGSYGPERLLSVLLYGGLAAFLLRRKKMEQITGREAQILEIRE
ncbi:MAG: CPBP family intramembrane metalloprotease [Oscillospiraceae bacterium]|nr:CPBP family intramembrane metalloprotease [Oscillospiraceae bacterium]